MNKFNNVFISHRSFDYLKAERLRSFLIKNNLCSNVILLKNETLCKNYEQLTVHEYYEAIEKLRKEINKCDSFLYLSCPNYTNGYYTSAELLQWRRIKDNPQIYPVREYNGTFLFEEPKKLQILTSKQKMRLSTIANMMEFNPEYGAALESWGKFAHECYLVGCCSCGHYYLITRNKMNDYIKTHELVKCPYCSTEHATFFQHKNGPKFFNNRFPIVMSPNVGKIADLKSLDVETIIELLEKDELPEGFKLVALPNDKLQSDFKKNMKEVAKVTGFIAASIIVIARVIKNIQK